VYAALDGVVDRVQRSADNRHGVYVRLSHFGGMVFTEYAHLAAVPRRLSPGLRVAAGEVIGLLGDTGLTDREQRHLYFALSVRPSSQFMEVYWDAGALMTTWTLRAPTRGTVAGLASLDGPEEREAGPPPPRRRRGRVH
jgi:murein DD-endopeptidase MepM/ murein hydrolase activator NlpD